MCLIAAICLLRIYAGDKPELTTLEVEQWIRYMHYAGVDEVYVYDAYEHAEESIRDWHRQINLPGVTYIDWHDHVPYSIRRTHVAAYQHAIERANCTWHIAMDIDEYPIVLDDLEPNFLHRLMDGLTETEYTFANFVFSGDPHDRQWLPMRMLRRFPRPLNNLCKPIYNPAHVRANIHHNIILQGRSVEFPWHTARMNHYWGGRLLNWGRDTNASLSQTIWDASIATIIQRLEMVPLVTPTLQVPITNRFFRLRHADHRIEL